MKDGGDGPGSCKYALRLSASALLMQLDQNREREREREREKEKERERAKQAGKYQVRKSITIARNRVNAGSGFLSPSGRNASPSV